MRDLRGLRQLRFKLHDRAAPNEPCLFPADFAAALAEMTQLTQLSAIGLAPAASLKHLPGSLRQLHLGTGGTGNTTRVCLSHLTELQSLCLDAPGGISAQSLLPACLTALTLTGPAKAVRGMSQLQRLDLRDVHAAMPFLQRTEIQANLQRLELGLHSCSQQHLQQFADAVRRCTQLTRLHLYNTWEGLATGDDPDIIMDLTRVQFQLHDLRQLRRLRLSQLKWELEGFSQLTVLSSLTKLKLDTCDVADTGLALAFQRLTGLRKLCLWTFLPDNECLLVAMACLSNLEFLDIRDDESELVVTVQTCQCCHL